MTSSFCVIGSPINHSLSPVIHNAANVALGLNFHYDRHEVSQGELSDFVRNNSFSGLSVTMPLKYEAFELAASCSQEAIKTGVANTLVRSGEGWIGHNTDVAGFVSILSQIEMPQSIVILGSGATARSASLALSSKFQDSKLSVIGRSIGAVDELVGLASSFGISARAEEESAEALLNADLVISTVPGTAFTELWEGVAAGSVRARGTLVDVVYKPWPSNASIAWASVSVSGLELLIWQAIEQVKIFAESQGRSVSLSDIELYGVMKNAVKTETGLN